MKTFNTRKGVFIKNNKNNLNIINTNLISLIPFIILFIIEVSIIPFYNSNISLYQVFKPIIIFIILIISGFILNKKDEINRNNIILQSIIYTLIININLNIFLIITIGILINMLNINKINRLSIGYLLIMLISNNQIYNYTTLKLEIISILLCIITIIYLSKYNFLKWRIIVFYIITIILEIILLYLKIKDNYLLLYIIVNKNIFKVLYLCMDMPSTPITHIGQITEGILIGIISLIGVYYNIFVKDVVIIMLILNIIIVLLNRIKIKI